MIKYNQELIDKLGIEFFELWKECKDRCEKIEYLLKQFSENQE